MIRVILNPHQSPPPLPPKQKHSSSFLSLATITSTLLLLLSTFSCIPTAAATTVNNAAFLLARGSSSPSSSSSFTSSSTFRSKTTIRNQTDNPNNNDNNTMTTPTTKPTTEKALTLGFIGCGTIASAIATGLLTQTTVPISKVHVTRRSESRSSALLREFPERVVVHDYEDNQNIVDESDVVFLCVLPQQEGEVLRGLGWNGAKGDDDDDDGKVLVSLVSTSKLKDLIENSGLPADKVYKMICLPSVAQHEGTPLLVPKSKNQSNLQTLLSTLGGGSMVQCETESIMESLMVTTCMMGPLYGLLRQNRDFLIRHGVPSQDASHFVGRQYLAMAVDAERKCGEDETWFDTLIEEQTPGGLNEQSLKNLEGEGFLEVYDRAMESILGRIRGVSDGSMVKRDDGGDNE